MFRAFLCLATALLFAHAIVAQNKKFDKSLRKVDAAFAAGYYHKATSSLAKLRAAVVAKMGAQNSYTPGLALRDARFNLASGTLEGFESLVDAALNSSKLAYGDSSVKYAASLIDVADIYNAYGNYRLSGEYLEQARVLLNAHADTDYQNARRSLVKSATLTGQGFCNEALETLNEIAPYFSKRAAEKEIIVDGTNRRTVKVPADELTQRYREFALVLFQTANAYGKKGALLSADSAFKAAQTWIRRNQKQLPETDLSLVENNYAYAQMLVDNGNEQRESELEFSNILSALKKRAMPTNRVGNDLYLAYLHQLLEGDNRSRYATTKQEYQKLIDKYYPKSSLMLINLKAIEFDAKLERDRTKDLEQDAANLLKSKSLPENYRTRIRILDFLHTIAVREKRYAHAATYLSQIADINKYLCGDTSPDYHLSRIRLACFYLDYTNNIEDAQKVFDESYLGIVAQEIGAWHKDHLNILNHLALLYETSDNYVAASATLDKASDVARSKFSDKDTEYGIELDRIAQLQIKLGQYEKAEANIEKSLKILDEYRKDPKRVGQLVSAMETQAKLYGVKGLFDEAERNLERSRRLLSRTDSKTNTNDLSSADQLTGIFIMLGRYSEADRLLRVQIPEFEKFFGANSIRLIEPLVHQSRILLAKGDYTEAERVASTAYQIAVSTYGEVSTKTAPTQRLLSDIYYTLGDYEKAELMVTRALASQEKQFSRNHIEVARSLAQLALITFYKGDDRKSVEALLLEARAIIEAKLNKDNPWYADIMKSLAVLYISERKFDLAFNALTVAETIWKAKTGTKNNVNAASIFTLTGDVYYQQKQYPKAIQFYNQSKDLYERFFSTSHPEYVKSLSKLAKVYYMQKDYKRSKRLIEESLTNYESFIKQYFPALSEREKAKYWNTIKTDFEFYNTLAFSNLDDFKDLTGKVYNYQLLTKALLLSSSKKIRERILNSTNEDLKSVFNQWTQKKEMLTLAISMSPEQLLESEINPGSLQQEVERLEKELSKQSELFAQGFENKRVTFEDIRKSLKQNETAVEIVRYRYFNHDFTDSIVYAALYLSRETNKPKAIVLADGKRLETRYFKYYRNSITGKIADQVSYGVFWKPIAEGIGQSSTIYLSADGVYNQINLEAIVTPDGKYVIDNANIVLVSNTKDLYLRKIKSKNDGGSNTASMFGNPQFYMTAYSKQVIAPLPGTEKEVAQLQFMLKEKGWITSEYLEQAATEEQVKGVNSPKIFHIATHGFYKPSPQLTLEAELESSEATLNQNPLMRTGLLLRGAGDLMEKTSYNYNMENGILTAYEAMSLNLDKTDLVVLSACETGLGDLEAGEGVYGLQRAFLVAGARVLVMSMFKVDDAATQRLMLKFYQKWLNSGQLRQSFVEAKKELRTEYPEPIYWGAFMMIGLSE